MAEPLERERGQARCGNGVRWLGSGERAIRCLESLKNKKKNVK